MKGNLFFLYITKKVKNMIYYAYQLLFNTDEEERMGATVFDVARYVLERVGTTTTMKMQKLVYYCQAWSLAWDNVPLFQEDFEAWANGPANRDLFNLHKGKYTIESYDIPASNYIFTQDELNTMDAVIDAYGDKTPLWLSEQTHNERPWQEARHGCAPGELCTSVITKDSMLEYYGGLI